MHCWQNRLLTVGSLSQGSVVNHGRSWPSRFFDNLLYFVVLFLVDELVLQVAFSYDITIIAVYDLPTVVRGLVGRVASPDHTHVKC